MRGKAARETRHHVPAAVNGERCHLGLAGLRSRCVAPTVAWRVACFHPAAPGPRSRSTRLHAWRAAVRSLDTVKEQASPTEFYIERYEQYAGARFRTQAEGAAAGAPSP
jgi:hypothetical protein